MLTPTVAGVAYQIRYELIRFYLIAQKRPKQMLEPSSI